MTPEPPRPPPATSPETSETGSHAAAAPHPSGYRQRAPPRDNRADQACGRDRTAAPEGSAHRTGNNEPSLIPRTAATADGSPGGAHRSPSPTFDSALTSPRPLAARAGARACAPPSYARAPGTPPDSCASTSPPGTNSSRTSPDDDPPIGRTLRTEPRRRRTTTLRSPRQHRHPVRPVVPAAPLTVTHPASRPPDLPPGH